MAGKTFPSLALAVKRIKENILTDPYVFIPGPVNSAICFIHPMAIKMNLDASNCVAMTCPSTLAVWVLVPPVINWTTTGNVTLFKYGHLEISYGLVNDMRNGTTKPIPTVMFSYASDGKKCLWVSMIFGSMITDVWSHIAVTVDSTQILKVFYNGKENKVTKGPCPDSASENTFVSSQLNLTCNDEFLTWDRLLNSEEIERIYNVTIFGGMSIYFLIKVKINTKGIRFPITLTGAVFSF